jgi:hypothetical protein
VNIGDRVIVDAHWSIMCGWTGTIVRSPDEYSSGWVAVDLDHNPVDDLPVPFRESELRVIA